MIKSKKSSNKILDRTLKVFGVLFIIAIVGVAIFVFVLNGELKKYNKVDDYCTNALRSEFATIYNGAAKDEDGNAYIDGVKIDDVEAFMENAYHLCMKNNGIPDSFLQFKSPYLFD